MTSSAGRRCIPLEARASSDAGESFNPGTALPWLAHAIVSWKDAEKVVHNSARVCRRTGMIGGLLITAGGEAAEAYRRSP